MTLYCWGCGSPSNSPDKVHFCSNCIEQHHFITEDQHSAIRYEYRIKNHRMPEPALNVKLKKEHFNVPIPPELESEIIEPMSCNFGGSICNVVPDRMTRHYDYASGDWIESRAEKRRIYKEKGMRMVSAKEEWRDKDKPRKFGHVASYAGQKNHQSSAERDGVRTATGQRVI